MAKTFEFPEENICNVASLSKSDQYKSQVDQIQEEKKSVAILLTYIFVNLSAQAWWTDDIHYVKNETQNLLHTDDNTAPTPPPSSHSFVNTQTWPNLKPL